MTAASALLNELIALGARVTVRGGRLVVDAPRGRISGEQRDRLADERDALVAYITIRAEIDAALERLAAGWRPGVTAGDQGFVDRWEMVNLAALRNCAEDVRSRLAELESYAMGRWATPA